MASEAHVWIAGDERTLALAAARHTIGEKVGDWTQLPDVEEGDAAKLATVLDVHVVHCVVQTSADLAWIKVFRHGRLVREVLSTADTEWSSSGRALPFEDEKALRALAKRRNGGAAVDPYRVIDAFLGRAQPLPEAPPEAKGRKAKPSRRVAMPARSEEADEDRFVVRAAWADQIDRRRGGWFVEPETVEAARAFDDARRALAPIAHVWAEARGRTQPQHLERMNAVKARFAEGAPADVASVEVEAASAVMLRAAYDPKPGQRHARSPLVDFWVGACGVAFAVECALAAFHQAGAGMPWHLSGPGFGALIHGPGISVVRTVRRHLASADAASYAAARQRAAERREGPPEVPHRQIRAAVAYLFPAERDWYDASIAENDRDFVGHDVYAWHYASAERSPFLHPNVTFGAEGLVFLPSMVEAFGRDLEPQLGREIGFADAARRPGSSAIDVLAEALSSIPTDDAMRTLASFRHLRPVQKQLAAAVTSYPARAARLGIRMP